MTFTLKYQYILCKIFTFSKFVKKSTYMYIMVEKWHHHLYGKVSYRPPSLVDCDMSSRVWADTVDPTRHWTIQ